MRERYAYSSLVPGLQSAARSRRPGAVRPLWRAGLLRSGGRSVDFSQDIRRGKTAPDSSSVQEAPTSACLPTQGEGFSFSGQADATNPLTVIRPAYSNYSRFGHRSGVVRRSRSRQPNEMKVERSTAQTPATLESDRVVMNRSTGWTNHHASVSGFDEPERLRAPHKHDPLRHRHSREGS